MQFIYNVSSSTFDFDIIVKKHVDLDGTFKAICQETGENLLINGWTVDLTFIEEIEA